MYSQEMPPTSQPVGVGSKYRVYVVWSTHREWYSPLVKWGIQHYQKSKPVFTHCFLVIQDIENESLIWIEIEHGATPSYAHVEYESVQYVDGKFTLVAFVGEDDDTTSIEFNAIDVTWYLTTTETDPIMRYLELGTYCNPLTLCSLARHIAPKWMNLTASAWTCSGYTGALIGMDSDQAYYNPPTPDQLYKLVCNWNASL